MFKLLEMYDGKLTVDISNLSDNERELFIEYKEEYLKALEEKHKQEMINKKQIKTGNLRTRTIGG